MSGGHYLYSALCRRCLITYQRFLDSPRVNAMWHYMAAATRMVPYIALQAAAPCCGCCGCSRGYLISGHLP